MKNEKQQQNNSRKNTTYFFVLLLFTFSLFVFPSQSDAATIARPQNNLGLVGYWSFDVGKSEGTTVYDHSGNGNNGTLNNATGSANWVAGKIGQGIDIDGNDDSVSITAGSALDFGSGNLTLSAWTYIRSVNSGANDTAIVTKYIIGASRTEHYGLKTDSDTTYEFTVRDSGSDEMTPTSTLIYNQWVHLVGVRDGDTAHLYVNGVLAASDTDASVGSTDNNDPLNIGDFQTTTSLDGVVDQVRVYDRALSMSEIQRLYKLGLQDGQKFNTTRTDVVTSGLVAYWTFDGVDMDEASTTSEVLGRGPSSLRGNIVEDAGDIFPVPGRIGQGLYFDDTTGDQDGVYILNGADTGLLTSVSAASVAVWVKLSGNFQAEQEVFFDINSTGGGSRFELKAEADGTFEVGGRALFTDGFQSVRTDNVLNREQWYHVVGMIDYANEMLYLYIDGQFSTSSDAVTFGAAQTESGEATDVRLGENSTNSTIQDLDGTLDEIRVYERLLTAAEISELYRAGSHDEINVSHKGRITNGLVGHWTFDGPLTSSTVAQDSSVSGNDMTFVGNAKPALGKVGQALTFDGSGDYVYVADNDIFSVDNTNELTVMAWVKPKSFASYMVPVSKGSFSNNYEWEIGIRTASNIRSQLWTDVSGTFMQTNSSETINLDEWAHVALVANLATPSLKVYVNGVEDGEDTTSSGSYANGNARTQIGERDDAVNDMNGEVDDVRIYDRALDAREIYDLYNMGR